MAEKYTDKAYYARHEANAGMIPDDFEGLGYYSRTSLSDMINGFIVAYVGPDKVLRSVPRHEVAFWAQRAVQEFSYDVLHSNCSIELEMSPSLTVPLPQDYVNYVRVTWVDAQGNQRVALPSAQKSGGTRPAEGLLQDDEFKYLYDDTGELLVADRSEAIKRFQDPNIFHDQYQAAVEYYGNYYNDDDYSYYYYSYYGKRYGNDPQRENINGDYIIDERVGLIYFDHTFAATTRVASNFNDATNDNFGSGPRIVTLEYVSDGLADNGDLTNVMVPKMAEGAVYADILYNLSKVRPSTLQAAPMYKKEASVLKRNTKIRLMNLKSSEIVQVMRGKSKWIKH